MSSTRKIAVVAGVFFIVTEIAGKVSLAVRGIRAPLPSAGAPACRAVRQA
jgi:hypothetical protein